MYTTRLKDDRGKTTTNWLDSSHTFSFAGYYDHNHMGYSDLRVINDDYIMPGGGFGEHSHENMEILTIVLKGTLEHKDSTGNVAGLTRGEVQRMSAGRGITHSEYNPSDKEHTHLLQIWVNTAEPDIEPEYEQKRFNVEAQPNLLHLIASPDGRGDSLVVHQNIEIYQASIEPGKSVDYLLKKDRKTWIHIAEGVVTVKNRALEAGDAMAISEEDEVIQIKAADMKSNVLIFSLRNLP